ncbi:MAG: PDZ domain-containing protein [Actinomycetota bacterium]|nr:PDZ domain-containing protein [Actinomycetota bacterium]
MEQPVGGPQGRHRVRSLVVTIIAVALLWAAFVVPIPIFFEYLPGPVRDVESLVHVTGAPTYGSQGHLYLTTVYVDINVTLAQVIGSLFRSDASIVLRQAVTGGASISKLLQDNRQMMSSSKMQAEALVLSQLGLGQPTGDGAEIQATTAGGPANNLLKQGDVVVAVDGHRVGTTCAAGKLLERHAVGDTVALTIRRSGGTKTVRLKTGDNPQDPGVPYLGVLWSNLHYRFQPKVHVAFKTGRIAGPSAGLMFALALYDKLTPNDLTGGRKIAGTGAIACDGAVGPIGGIQEKVAAAEKQGAQIFLAPRSEAPDAAQVASGMKIVPVMTFDGALRYLKGLSR